MHVDVCLVLGLQAFGASHLLADVWILRILVVGHNTGFIRRKITDIIRPNDQGSKM